MCSHIYLSYFNFLSALLSFSCTNPAYPKACADTCYAYDSVFCVSPQLDSCAAFPAGSTCCGADGAIAHACAKGTACTSSYTCVNPSSSSYSSGDETSGSSNSGTVAGVVIGVLIGVSLVGCAIYNYATKAQQVAAAQ